MERDKSDCEPMCVFPEERDVIHDLRSLEFGRVSIFIQNGVLKNLFHRAIAPRLPPAQRQPKYPCSSMRVVESAYQVIWSWCRR